jgi:hypothetical protein
MAIGLVACAACGSNRDELARSDVGEAPYCESVALWPSISIELEDELLQSVQSARVDGLPCPEEEDTGTGGESGADGEPGTGGESPPAGTSPGLPLTPTPELRCAARMRALDLIGGADDEPDPLATFERLVLAGYTGLPRHEALAFDFVDADDVLQAWLDSPQHCTAILDRFIDDVGAGYARSSRGDDIAWVLVTGERRE